MRNVKLTDDFVKIKLFITIRLFILLLLAFLISLFFIKNELYFYIAGGIVLFDGFYIVYESLFYYPKFYQRFRAYIYNDILVIKKGVIFKQTILLPKEKINFLKMKQSPIQRKFHCFDLCMVTIGEEYLIEMLNERDTEYLRTQLQ